MLNRNYAKPHFHTNAFRMLSNPVIKLCVKLFIFLLPFCLFFSPVILSGEYFGGGYYAIRQNTDKQSMLYGPIAEDQYKYYKAEAARLANPSVLALGDSRALTIPAFFFKRDVSFYNAGYSVVDTADMQYFLEHQNTQDMDYVIISLSHFSFNSNFRDIEQPTHTDFSTQSSLHGVHGIDFASSGQFFIKSLMAGNFAFVENTFKPNIAGLNAKANQNGMLNDGSYFYGEVFRKTASGQSAGDRVADTLNRIEHADRAFQHGEHVNPNAIDSLEEFLEFCTERNIYVIAYAPPYAPTVNEAMDQHGGDYGYQKEMLALLPSIFTAHGYEFHDYTDAAFLGCTDDFYIDGFHGSEVVFLRMFIDMIENGSRLKDICDLSDLQAYDMARFSDLRILQTWEEYNDLILNRL